MQPIPLVLMILILSGCSVVTTRPTQDMFNADAALKAAKALHADTLSPELFRLANENYYKAKREYRAKNFDTARRFAIKTIKLAEKSEFEAYVKGGANPEIAAGQTAHEGASGDPDVALKTAHELREKQETQDQRVLYETLKKQEMEAAEVRVRAKAEEKERAKADAQEPTLPTDKSTDTLPNGGMK